MPFECSEAVKIYANEGNKAGDAYLADYFREESQGSFLLIVRSGIKRNFNDIVYYFGTKPLVSADIKIQNIADFARNIEDEYHLFEDISLFKGVCSGDKEIRYFTLIPLKVTSVFLGFILIGQANKVIPKFSETAINLILHSFQQKTSTDQGLNESNSKLAVQEYLYEKVLLYEEELKSQNIELREKQSELEEIKDHYKHLFEYSPIGKVVVKTNGNIVSINRKFRKWFCENENSNPTYIYTLFSEHSNKTINYLLNEIIYNEETKSITLNITKNDSTFYFEVRASKISNVGSEALVILTFIDVTIVKQTQKSTLSKSIAYLNIAEDYKRINRELSINQQELQIRLDQIDTLYKELEKHKKLLIETGTSAKVGGWEYFIDANKINWTDETFNIHEVPIGTNISLEKAFSYYHPDWQERIMHAVQECTEKKKPFKFDLKLITAKKNIIWVKVFGKYEEIDGVKRIFGAIQDITEQKENQDRVADLVELFDLSPDLLSITDLNGYFVELNPAWEQTLGYTIEELKSQPFFEFVHPDDLKKSIDEAHRVIKDDDKTTLSFINRYRCKDNSYRWFSWKCITKIRNKRGITFSVTRDITEEVKAREELEKLALIVKHTDNDVIFTDRTGRIEWVNEGFEEFTGYSLAEIIGKKPSEFLQGKETNRAETRKFSKAIKEGRPFSTKIINYKKSGEKYWAEVDMRPIKDENGRIIKLFSVQKNITLRVNAEKEVTKRQERLSLATSAAKIGVWDWTFNDTEEEIYIDETFELKHVKKDPNCSFYELLNVIHPSDKNYIINKINIAIKQGKKFDEEFRVLRPNNIIRYVKSTARINQNQHGKTIRMIGVHWDITTSKENELKVQKLNDELETKVRERTSELEATNMALSKAKSDLYEAYSKEKEISQLKSRFVATASHQFRTPLTVIKSNIEILELFQDKLSEDLKNRFSKSFNRIHQETTRMTDLMNDVLTLEKINSGALVLTKEYINVKDMMEDLVSSMNQVAKHKSKIHLNVVNNEKPVFLDKSLFSHIMINVLNNAQKYSIYETPVELEINYKKDYLKLEVKDQGIGMSDKDLKNIFQPFYRGKNTDGIQGTGLGMSIIYEYIKLNDGLIDIKSEIDKGTIVTLTFPL